MIKFKMLVSRFPESDINNLIIIIL